MSPTPTVRCSGCGFAWNSTAMAEGLRLLGSCPKCDGELEFREDARRHDAQDIRFAPALAAERRGSAPHLVLGIPRR